MQTGEVEKVYGARADPAVGDDPGQRSETPHLQTAAGELLTDAGTAETHRHLRTQQDLLPLPRRSQSGIILLEGILK